MNDECPAHPILLGLITLIIIFDENDKLCISPILRLPIANGSHEHPVIFALR
jgi:hypothetical protein